MHRTQDQKKSGHAGSRRCTYRDKKIARQIRKQLAQKQKKQKS